LSVTYTKKDIVGMFNGLFFVDQNSQTLRF